MNNTSDLDKFKIEQGEKFALVIVSNLHRVEGLSAPIELDKNLWFLPKPPPLSTEPWQKWRGSLVTENINKASFCLLIKKRSDQLEILNNENESLMEQTEELFYCVIFQGLPIADDAYVLSGANIDGTNDIRRHADLIPLVNINTAKPAIINLETLKQALIMKKTYHYIKDTVDFFKRLRRGFHSLIRAIWEENVDFRMHDYVRALEAIVKPRFGSTKDDFVHRCQSLAKASNETRQIILDIYNLRSANEHLDDWLKPVGGNEKIAMERLWQVENLALKSYTKLLVSPSLLQIFKTDNEIDDFWNLPCHKRQELWNNPVDIRKYKWINNEYGYAEAREI
jgi:hypothetical protein